MKKLTSEEKKALQTVETSKRLGYTAAEMKKMHYNVFDMNRADLKGSKLASAFVTAYYAFHA